MSTSLAQVFQESVLSIEDASWWLETHEALPCISLLEQDGWIVAQNLIARQLTGTSLGEAVPVADLLGNNFSARRQDRERFEGRLTKRDGSTVHGTGVAKKIIRNRVPYQLILLLESEDDLPGSAEVSATMLKDLLDAAPEATAITRDGRILHVNRRFVELFGYTLAECAGKSLSSLVVPDGRRHETETLLHILQNNERSSLQTTRKTHAGEEVDVLLVMSRVRLGDDSAGLLITYQDIRPQKSQPARPQHTALHDVLTGLPNRELFLNRLQLTMARLRRRPDRKFAVLLLDLDGFNKINETHGHATGDAVLLHVRDRLLSSLCSRDTVARLGGDQFAILLDDAGSAEQAVIRLQCVLQAPLEIDGASVRLTASIGIVVGTSDYRVAEEMTRDADQAMYQARAAGIGSHTLLERPRNCPR